MKVLVIDDDVKLGALLVQYLQQQGATALHVASPEEGLRRAKAEAPDVLVLDVMMPGMSGFDVLKALRARGDALPVLMLTARGDLADKVAGLELGADDYLAKPFEPRELLARLQAILRRGRLAGSAEVQVLGPLSVDHSRKAASLKGKDLGLSALEFDALAILVQHSGQVLTRDQLMERLKGLEHEAFDRSVDVLVSRLRQKLKDDPRKPRYIRTVYGTGYEFLRQA
jgi:two-component system phosphate regulon response regulator OmpR